MKKNSIQLTEAQLHQIITESVQSLLAENEEEEGWGDFAKSIGKGLKAGWNGFKTSELTDNDWNQPKYGHAKDTLNFMDELLAQEKKLQVQLNQVRKKRMDLEKRYGAQKGKGLDSRYNYLNAGLGNGRMNTGKTGSYRQAATQSNQDFLNTAH